MKNLLLFLILITVVDNVKSQDLNVTFEVEDGATSIDEVVATNLTTGESVTLPGYETLVLHSVATRIKELPSFEGVSFFPNPYVNFAHLYFSCSMKENITIKMTASDGNVVASRQMVLNEGVHDFKVSGVAPDFYIVTIVTGGKVRSVKVVQNSIGSNSIEYMGAVNQNKVIHNSTLKASSEVYVLDYSPEDIISYSIRSGENITVINETPSESKSFVVTIVPCKDIDNINYKTVKIGIQIWMAENLKVTHYPNGDAIPLVPDYAAWGKLGDNNIDDAYCFYNNNAGLGYGALYTYAAAVNGTPQTGTNRVQGVCPDGWHLPSDAEWTEMVNYITSDGHSGTEGNALKTKTGWGNNGNGTDDYGFSAPPGGNRYYGNGSFDYLGYVGHWWSSTEGNNSTAFDRHLRYTPAGVGRWNYEKSYGFSVRCLRD